MKKKNNLFIGIIGIIIVCVLLIFMFSKDNSELLSPAAFEALMDSGAPAEVVVDNDYIRFKLNDKAYKVAIFGINPSLLKNIPISVEDNKSANIFFYIVLGIVVMAVVFAFFWRKKSQNPPLLSSASLNQSATFKEESLSKPTLESSSLTSSVRFRDVAGIKEVKDELIEIIDYLKNPQKYQSLGISLPKGVLLVGPPGVGKTMIAKAVAGEANVPFFYQSGSSFVQIYVGMGAKRVRELFSKAKARAPSIIFIDEIDAVGKARGEGRNDEREATLNELLTEMDGFEENNSVIVIGATNNIEVIDEALLRSGRFDRRIYVDLPDLQERIQIFEIYLENKKHDLDLSEISKMCVGFSGAMIASVVNESALNALRRGSESIQMQDILDVKDKVALGKKKILAFSEEEKNILSLYQSAKAVSAYWLDVDFDKVTLVSDFIIDRDKEILSKSEMNNRIKVYLSGIIALELIMNEKYTNAKEDIKKAKNIAEEMCQSYGMSERIIGNESDVSRILSNAYEEQTEFLNNSKQSILVLAKILLEKERLSKQNIEEIMQNAL